MENNSEILVTVGVITYNSEITIIEALESVKNQSYHNIELIISDDASCDETVSLCDNWCRKNKSHFVRTEILTIKENTGVPSNINRIIKTANGHWLRLLSGDDVLLPNCIETLLFHSNVHPEFRWMASKYKVYNDIIDERHFDKKRSEREFSEQYLNLFKNDRLTFLHCMIRNHFIASPFFQISLLREIGGYDEKYRLCEDMPLTIKLLEKGYMPLFVNEYTMGYRRNSASITSTTGGQLFNFPFQKCKFEIVHDLCFKYLSNSEKKQSKHILSVYNFFYKLGLKNNKFNRQILRICLGIARRI